MRVMIGDSAVEIVEGDVINQNTQAIVNAVHRSLLGAGGLDGRIVRAAGLEVHEECKSLGGCDVGEARITSGGKLRAKHIIHTAGPVYRGGKNREAELLARSYGQCLELAVLHGIKRIAFPSISTGANGYPPDEASEIALRTTFAFLAFHPELFLVRFVLESREVYKSFELALRKFARR